MNWRDVFDFFKFVTLGVMGWVILFWAIGFVVVTLARFSM